MDTSAPGVFNRVPCNGCTMCCHADAVGLQPGEVEKFKHEKHPYKPGQFCLAHKPNGDCVYLGVAGCTIHSDKPLLCQEMDCRVIYSRVPRKEARRLHHRKLVKLAIWEKGRELMGRHK